MPVITLTILPERGQDKHFVSFLSTGPSMSYTTSFFAQSPANHPAKFPVRSIVLCFRHFCFHKRIIYIGTSQHGNARLLFKNESLLIEDIGVIDASCNLPCINTGTNDSANNGDTFLHCFQWQFASNHLEYPAEDTSHVLRLD